MPNEFGYTNLNYFGVRGLVAENPAEVVTDLYGLETCSSTYKIPRDQFSIVQNGNLSMFSSHPIFGYLHMERRRVLFDKGFFTVTGEYAGIPVSQTESIFELIIGLSEAPIETHPKFVTDIGGTPSSPLNGALFLDPSGVVSTDDASGVFDRFKSVIGSSRNQFAGISSYLETSEMTWRETYITTSRPQDADLVGHIQSPHGNYPSLGSGQNWLYFGLTYQQRGLCFTVSREWKASGRRGWNETIYG